MNEPQYEIETSDYHCAGCNEEVGRGRQYFSAVLFAEELFHRRNYCVACWEQSRLDNPGDSATGKGAGDLYAYWKTRRPQPPDRKLRRVGFDPTLVMRFFRRLSEEQESKTPPEAQKRDLGFVLALLLVRKKFLHFESAVQRDGGEWLKLSERGDPSRIYWVENPELTDEELERVRDDIGELLQMQF